MLTTIEEPTVTSAGGPACLWQENPHRLVSLWDMYQIAAHNFVHIGRVLQSLQLNPALKLDSEYPSPEDMGRFIEEMKALLNQCDQLKLLSSSGIINYAIQECSMTRRTYGQINSTVEYISAAFQQELGRNFFAYIDPARAKYFRSLDDAISNPPFGSETLKAFPGALRDISLGGNCLAYGVNDACVFHSMRALEKGLEALTKVFSVPFKFENWHNIIEQLESKVRKMDPSFGADWKDKQKFYSEAASQFMFFKDAWRNHVMHGRSEYDDEQAENVYGHVCVFMKQLAQGGLTE